MTLLYFAWVRQKIGKSEERFELPAGIKTVGELAEHLRERGNGYADAFSHLARVHAAVNHEHVNWSAPISAGDEIAFFPPVTGG